ncbi:hypothetical protein H0H81_001277 [Sphagnurus paluster]|uniref:Tetrapyrrole biosynthesis uroporphyrinogen III synthase domain-containing protein n=1 Tax=Sphagnurus paluster TaxID=117069 RepID=A0A9P7GHV7_9AGAR|nr:hypothetical protein H0H81_001277 [Sphagnurus paluster]
MANILLLRVPSQGEDDRYAATFTQAGYRALPVPVLETVWCNLPTLKSIIEAGPRAAGFEGVILTSARSSEAWKTVVEDLADTSSDPGNVGEATAAVLKQMQQGTPYTPQIIRGEASGTGKRLAQFICEQADGKPKKLLYLTGDKNRDTVPTILAQAGVEFRSLKVYETQGSCTFARDLKDALKIASAGNF